jgi:chaperone required for assembly of F1-ATPase
MTGWTRKRFWKSVTVAPRDGGFGVLLDDRAVQTPAKVPLVLPTRALADMVAAEWAAQEGEIRPDAMPATRAANSAIDIAAPGLDDLKEHIASYGETDLLCYRAEGPQALVDLQAAGWDPLLEWAATALHAPMIVTRGVMFIAQPSGSLAALRAVLDRYDTFRLTALSDLVTLSGSLVLGLAVAKRRLKAETAWPLSRIDEDWQERQWGRDDEAAALAERRRRGFMAAARFLDGAEEA